MHPQEELARREMDLILAGTPLAWLVVWVSRTGGGLLRLMPTLPGRYQEPVATLRRQSSGGPTACRTDHWE